MTGDDFGVDVEYRLLRVLLSEIRDDGQMYFPFQCQGPSQETSCPQSNCILMFALPRVGEKKVTMAVHQFAGGGCDCCLQGGAYWRGCHRQ